jgi:hypothetical protein
VIMGELLGWAMTDGQQALVIHGGC